MGPTPPTGRSCFTGGLRLGWNPSTGARQGDLLLLGARVYDAAMKRWLQADLVDEKRYTYADGDPVNKVDPSGRLPWEFGRESSPVWNADPSPPKPQDPPPQPCPDGKPACELEEQVVRTGQRPTAADRAAAGLYREMYYASMSVPRERTRPSAWETFTRRAGQNWHMTTSTVMSPVRLAVSYVGFGKRPGWGDVALGVGAWEAFALATGTFLTGAGVPTVAGVLEAGIVSNGGLAPALYAVAGEAAAVLAVRASLVAGAAFLGIGVGSVIEAAGYTLYTRLFP